MSLKLFVGSNPVAVTRTVFPAGETCLRIEDKNLASFGAVNVLITMQFESNTDLFDLAMLVDAVRRLYIQGSDISLRMDYLPYARQDRVCNKGESLSVKVVADFINSLKFDRVFCKDIHSSVGVALIHKLIHIDLSACSRKLSLYENNGDVVIVSPDAGAEKKVFDFAKAAGYTEVIRASKVRNVLTGKIERTTIIDDKLTSKNYLIVDDICDGGRTFIELAKVLRSGATRHNKISLYVTHGIFSAGLDVFTGFIDKIYVVNLMNDAYKDHPLLQIL